MTVNNSSHDCQKARRAFSEAWDGALAGVETRQLDEHLAGCSDCRGEKERYDAALDAFGPALSRMVEGARPALPFPQSSPRLFLPLGSWLRPAALVLSAFAVGFVAIDHHRRGLVLPPTASPVASAVQNRPCPWHVTRPEDVLGSVSYPVMADPCLESDFELVEARVKTGRACAEGVQLTYRSGARTLVLEQLPEQSSARCPVDRVVMERVAGCLEDVAQGATALVWSQGKQGFRLEGDVAPGEAVAFARAISASLGEL